MKSWLICTGLISLLTLPGQAQFMQGAAPEGVSSLIGGKTVSLDVNKTSLRFDYTGKFGKNAKGIKNKPYSNSYLNWGLSLIGGNNNNIAQLITKGAFTPSGNASAFVFWGKTLNQTSRNQILDPLLNINQELKKIDRQFTIDINTEMNRLKNALVSSNASLQSKVNALANGFDGNLGALILDLRDLRQTDVQTAGATLQLDQTINRLTDIETAHRDNRERLELRERQQTIQQEYRDFDRLNPYKRIVVYARAGTSATKYKFYQTLNSQNFSRSFTDTLFNGHFGEIGVNLYSKSYLIWGLAAGLIRNNTLQGAAPEKIIIERTATDALGQTINTKQEVTAYQGRYIQYQQVYIKGDVVGLLPTSERGTFAINPFFRYAHVSDNTLPSSLRIGINGYFFNQKGGFLGGLYIERTYRFTSVNGNTFSVSRLGLDFGLRASFLFSTVFDTARPNP
ncbi:hypothetical protein [Spirosoma montaniterrae]|uniref:Uncharacterized protein n=1 Tax=Spirosoma montaniterrae TaxID=1178516 RepID=A0A1P9WT28_9BACT|nr:hypothetical protein [Spirosoma montaniterrae]AQG78518.1 hypothetical protein AWR27_03670 [Spirosoma montaniterrae]